MSAIIGTPQYVDYFDNPHGVVQGAIGSALVAGSVIGSLFAGPLSDRIGRRDAISGACFFWLAGTAVQVSCNGIGMLIAGRVLNDVCVGVTSGYPIRPCCSPDARYPLPASLIPLARRSRPRETSHRRPRRYPSQR